MRTRLVAVLTLLNRVDVWIRIGESAIRRDAGGMQIRRAQLGSRVRFLGRLSPLAAQEKVLPEKNHEAHLLSEIIGTAKCYSDTAIASLRQLRQECEIDVSHDASPFVPGTEKLSSIQWVALRSWESVRRCSGFPPSCDADPMVAPMWRCSPYWIV